MPASGELDQYITFQQREEDANGDRLGADWDETTQLRLPAKVVFQRGGEVGLAARLEGRIPVVLVIRDSSESRAITTAWRATDAQGRVYNLRSAYPHRDRGFIEIQAETGDVAEG